MSGISGSTEVNRGDYVQINGKDLDLVRRVLVDGLATKYLLARDSSIRVKIPNSAQPGDASITLLGDFETILLSNFVSIAPIDLALSSKVTVGTFGGYVAIYTKNLRGKRLSIQVGDRWRVLDALASNYTQNLVKVGIGKSAQTKVLVDRQLVKVRKLTVR